MAKPLSFSIPFSVDITKERNWNRAQNHPYGYWIVRCHFAARRRQTKDIARYGRKLAVFEFSPGQEATIERTLKTEVTNVEVTESFQESMRQDESLLAFANSIASSISMSPLGKLSAEAKAEAQERLIESFKESFRVQSVVTRREERECKLTSKIDPSAAGRLVAVAMHQRYAFDLYLTWVDYLSVRYIRRLLGLRKKRTKRPLPLGKDPNWWCPNVPLATAHFWLPLPDSAVVIGEDGYENEVDGEDEVETGAPEDHHQYVAPKPDVPTLYQISNATFPLKWVKREGDWTEDELRELEEGEPNVIEWSWQ
jgi:hypothetical protein